MINTFKHDILKIVFDIRMTFEYLLPKRQLSRLYARNTFCEIVNNVAKINNIKNDAVRSAVSSKGGILIKFDNKHKTANERERESER